jgi:urea transporter
VFLCNHPITGIFILIGLGITSIELVGYALLGAIFGTMGAALIGRPPMHDITSGLCGYDAALVGCASWAFLSDFSCRALIAAILSFISGIVHVACANILNVFDLPTFTLAFNITMICFLLSVSTNHAKVITLRKSSSINYPDNYTDMSIEFMVDASIRGVGQFMFVDTTVGSSFVIFGIAISSRIGAFAAWTGSTVACLTAYYLLQVADLASVRTGLFGYNSSGCVTSLSGNVFFYSNIPNFLSGSIIGGSFTVLILTAFQSVFGTLPVLTFPFITTTWLMMMTRSNLFVLLTEPDPNNVMLSSSSHHSHHSFEKIKI